jgi:prepilin-type N-terminal cleavage/methylation domain-containing protein
MSRSSPHIDSIKRRASVAKSGDGFTLIEILIATAIVVFLVAILAQILSATHGIWRNSEARTDPFRDARAAIELMSRELAVVVTHDRAPVLALENVYSQPGDTDGPLHNQQAYALVPKRNVDTNNPAINNSDLCAVGFYCTWDNSRHAYVLRRHFFASDATFTRLQGAGLPAAPGPISPTTVYAPSSPVVSPAQDEDVAAYVWDLKIVPYEFNAGVLTQNATYPVTYNSTLPQFIEISFKAMSPQAARQLTAQGIGTGVWFDSTSPVYRNQILPHMHQFSTRVKLHDAARP